MRLPRAVRGLAAVALILLPPSLAGIPESSLQPLFPMSFMFSPPSIQIAPDGTPHILFPSVNDRLRHAWRESGRWRDEALEARLVFHDSRTLAVDSTGRPHITYTAVSEDAPGEAILMYAVREESGWFFTTLTSSIQVAPRPTIAIGPDDIPRILFLGTGTHILSVARPVAGIWQITNTPFSDTGYSTDLSLAIDGDGHSHILFRQGGPLAYATDASGEWVGSDIVPGQGMLALDAEGRPHVVASVGELGELSHFRMGEEGWQGEEINPTGEPNIFRYVSGLTMDDAGHISVAYVDGRFVRSDHQSSARVAYYDGIEWRNGRRLFLDRGLATSAAPGPDGSFQIALAGSRLRHLAIARPDLSAEWEDVTTESVGDHVAVSGRLVVRNLGPARSRATRIALRLSDDDGFDETDAPVGIAFRLGALKSKGVARFPVHVRLPEGSAGKRLLAVVDPVRRHEDIDRPNNTAAVVVGE